MAGLRVLIVADDPLVRAGLQKLLARRADISVVGHLSADRSMIAEIERLSPEVLLWDAGWEAEGLHEQLLEPLNVGVPTVVLLPDATHAAEAMTENVHGLLLRDVEAEELSIALRAAAQGLFVATTSLAAALLPARSSPDMALIEPLTPRELEVLQLLAEGLSNKMIAQRLQISEHTVKFHVNALMSKLGAQTRTEAVVRATRQGLILL